MKFSKLILGGIIYLRGARIFAELTYFPMAAAESILSLIFLQFRLAIKLRVHNPQCSEMHSA